MFDNREQEERRKGDVVLGHRETFPKQEHKKRVYPKQIDLLNELQEKRKETYHRAKFAGYSDLY